MFSHPHVLDSLVLHLRTRREALITQWGRSIETDPRMRTTSHLTRREFKNHIPQVLEAFGASLLLLHEQKQPDSGLDEMHSQANPGVEAAAKKHGAHRWQQGYSLEEMAREWGHLSLVVLDEIEQFATQEADAPWAQVRRLWVQTVANGISASAARFNELARSQAEGRMRDLEGVLEKVRAFDRERGEILRQASHDLRGSLTVVKGAASLLEPGLLDRLKTEDLTQLIQMLNSGVEALSQMMGDLLDLARLEAEQEQRVLEPFDVGEMLSELGHTLRMLAQEKGLKFVTDGPASLEVENDRGKVNRIAQNLLLNAVKYTETGHVCLAWHRLEKGDAHHWELVVSDTGTGLQSAQAPMAQELLATTKEAHAIGATIPSAPSTVPPPSPRVGANIHTLSYAAGEGVGLSIVKRLCELLDAVLELESGPTGTTFRIVFPLEYSTNSG